MPIISVKDNENNRWKRNAKKKNKADGSYSERVRDKWFCWAFKFLQLIGKASLIFKSNLEIALSNFLKERELYESKHVAVECTCLKIWDLLSFSTCYSILVLATSFVNIARTAASTSKFIYQEKFQISGIGYLYEK